MLGIIFAGGLIKVPATIWSFPVFAISRDTLWYRYIISGFPMSHAFQYVSGVWLLNGIFVSLKASKLGWASAELLRWKVLELLSQGKVIAESLSWKVLGYLHAQLSLQVRCNPTAAPLSQRWPAGWAASYAPILLQNLLLTRNGASTMQKPSSTVAAKESWDIAAVCWQPFVKVPWHCRMCHSTGSRRSMVRGWGQEGRASWWAGGHNSRLGTSPRATQRILVENLYLIRYFCNIYNWIIRYVSLKVESIDSKMLV